jgi:hypothetical protein
VKIQTLFYKTHTDFAKEYDVNEEHVLLLLCDCEVTDPANATPLATLLGMTEYEMLNKLGLLTVLEGVEEKDDPRSQLYIIYISSNI